MTPDEPLYNEAVTVHRTGSCDVDALQAAFNLILSRNDAWRTTFEAWTACRTRSFAPTST